MLVMNDSAGQLHSSQFTQRGPIAELLGLAMPTVAQMASYTLMQFIDTLMLARVGRGVLEPTAASNAGVLAFAAISLGFGTLMVVNTLVSQSFGRKDFESCGRYLWQGVWFAITYSLLLLPIIPLVGSIFHWAGHDPALFRLESLYLRIVLFGAVLKLVGATFSQFLLAVDRPWLALVASASGVALNALAAWMLIFGHFGFGKMGVTGSAIAQNIGVGFEMLVAIAFAFRSDLRRAFHVMQWRLRPGMFATLLKVGIPSGVQVVSEVLAWSMFLIWVMAPLGTQIMAANTFMIRYMTVSFMPAFGISVAVTALVGRYIGMNRIDVAKNRADLGFALAAAYMVLCGLGFFLGRHVLIGLFSQDPVVLRAGAVLMVFAAIYQFFDAMYIIYNGGLRGAGDTFVPAVVTALLCWGLNVTGGWLVARSHPQWGAAGPWTAATTYGIILGFFLMLRFRRGNWKAIATAENGAAAISQSKEPSTTLSPFGAPAS